MAYYLHQQSQASAAYYRFDCLNMLRVHAMSRFGSHDTCQVFYLSFLAIHLYPIATLIHFEMFLHIPQAPACIVDAQLTTEIDDQQRKQHFVLCA